MGFTSIGMADWRPRTNYYPRKQYFNQHNQYYNPYYNPYRTYPPYYPYQYEPYRFSTPGTYYYWNGIIIVY